MCELNLLRIFVILTLLGFSSKAQNVQTPQSFKICPKSSPNLAGCVKNSVEFLRPYLKNGDLGNGFKIPPLEPMSFDDIFLERGSGFFFNLYNIKAYNIHNFNIDKLRITLEPNVVADLLIKIKNVECSGDYKLNLLLGIVNLQGHGKIEGKIDEIKARIKIETVPLFRDGVEYKNVTRVPAVVKIDNLVLKIHDLFKDKVLNDVGERLVNQNLNLFLPEIEKSVSNSLCKNFLQIILVILASHHAASTVAPSIKPCPRNIEKFSDCIINAIDGLKPQISTGIFGPDLILDTNLTKLVVGEVSVNKSFNLKMSGLYALGLNDFKVNKLRITLDKFKVDAIVSFKHLDAFARYSLVWNLGIFALQGAGDLKISIDNPKVLLRLIGSRYLKNDVEYLKIDKTSLSIKSAQVKVYFDNLFNGQKSLEEAANDVVNQNIDIIKGDVFPVIEQSIGNIVQKMANQVFESASYDEFFPLN
ncbi:uncharacterized protein [Chironomus tepperi]|uniref:uncharacterized protein n=1 Tax=Chironomus tepperi TaxID=113505 RepID=UPI00391F8487